VTLGDLIETPPHGGENRQPFLQRALGAACSVMGPDWLLRPRQNRVRQSLPLSDSETTAGESFTDG
jgi:hypothetical protein